MSAGICPNFDLPAHDGGELYASDETDGQSQQAYHAAYRRALKGLSGTDASATAWLGWRHPERDRLSW